MKYKEDDIVLCTVRKIEGTSVFLDLEDGSAGTMVLSEVSPGRIRNLRAYVAPNKKVVCKVLNVENGRIELSLRRVTAKERERVLENYKKERALEKMVKIIGENPEKIISKIKESYEIADFLIEARNDVKVLERFMSREKAQKLFGIIAEREGKKKKVEKNFVLKSLSEKGVRDIQDVLKCEECEIHYHGSGKFSISILGGDFKEANSKMENVLRSIGKRAKEKNVLFEMMREK